MKIRSNFISNSSSSSFIVNIKDLTDEQIVKLVRHKDVIVDEYDYPWALDINTYTGDINCSISICNFELDVYLHEIGVSAEAIKEYEGG